MRDVQSLSATSAAEGLSRFLQRLAESRREELAGTTDLRRFLDRAGPFLRAACAPVTQPPPVAFDVSRFRRTFSTLAQPLRLAPPLSEPLNVWAIAGLKQDEIRNAAVLAWFLKPYGSHGCGSAALRALLDEVKQINPGWPQLSEDLSRVSVMTEEYPLGSATERVDIAITGLDFVLFIEVKIAAPEGPDQLRRYVEAIERKARALGRKHGRVIYLSKTPPRDPPLGVAIITWREVARALSSLPPTGTGSMLAMQFVQHIRAFT